MLFIGDTHIKSEKKDEIFGKLKDILDNTDETNIIFLGDYIYHFAYNPNIIGEFFNLLLEYSQKNKKIYILAGNHDYIKGHFIFAEAEKLANLANLENIKIISNPKIEIIEDKKVLFFPFYTKITNEEDFINTDKKIKKLKNRKDKDLILNLYFIAYQNWKQDNKNQKISGTINLDLVNFIIENKDIDIFVHHFYTANTAFPGQFAKFSYKNIALCDEIFKADFDIVSGHLHKCFKHKNYICVGSFWNTSPLEEDDTKIIFTYPDKFQQVIINPYISCDNIENVENIENFIKNKWKQIEKETENNLGVKIKKEKLDLNKVNFIVKNDKFIDLKQYIDENTLNKLENVSFRQVSKKNIENIVDKLQIDKDKLAYSFESWKDLSKDYIEKKYPEKSSEYLKVLEELGLV